MNIDLDELLRDVVASIETDAPTVTFDEIAARRQGAIGRFAAEPNVSTEFVDVGDGWVRADVTGRRSGRRVIALVTAAAVVAGLLAVAARPDARSSRPAATQPAGSAVTTAGGSPNATSEVSVSASSVTTTPSPSSPPAITTPPPTASATVVHLDVSTQAAVTPTLVEPGSPPDGYVFMAGGSVQMFGGTPRLGVYATDRAARMNLGWSDRGPCTTPSPTTPFGPVPTDVEAAIAQHDADISTGADAVSGQLRWCAGSFDVSITVNGVDVAIVDAFARSVVVIDAARADVVVPARFGSYLGAVTSTNAALVYGGPHGARLRVLSFAVLPGGFDALLGDYGVAPIEIGGRRATWSEPGQIVLEWDDHTIVYVDGTDLDRDGLVQVAGNLLVADPALAPLNGADCGILQICG